jgi:hypothetical protein
MDVGNRGEPKHPHAAVDRSNHFLHR